MPDAVIYERAARVLSVDVEVPWEEVSKRLRTVMNKLVLLMHPTPDKVGGILLPDSQKRIRADVGTVVAAPEPFEMYGRTVTPPPVGTVCLCHPADGSTVIWEGHTIKSIGAFLGTQEWVPMSYPWYESVMAMIVDGELVALGDKVVIQLDEMSDRTESGLLIPDTAQRWKADATIISVGDVNTGALKDKEGGRVSVDMNLVTVGGLECIFGKDFKRMFVIPQSAINFIYN